MRLQSWTKLIIDQFIKFIFCLKKKIPIIKLSIASIILLMAALGFLRFYGDFDPNTKYSPAKYEDGELKPAENK